MQIQKGGLSTLDARHIWHIEIADHLQQYITVVVCLVQFMLDLNADIINNGVARRPTTTSFGPAA